MDPKNYHGIIFVTVALKLMRKILAEEISHGINEEQRGFRQNRSRIAAILILTQIQAIIPVAIKTWKETINRR